MHVGRSNIEDVSTHRHRLQSVYLTNDWNNSVLSAFNRISFQLDQSTHQHQKKLAGQSTADLTVVTVIGGECSLGKVRCSWMISRMLFSSGGGRRRIHSVVRLTNQALSMKQTATTNRRIAMGCNCTVTTYRTHTPYRRHMAQWKHIKTFFYILVHSVAFLLLFVWIANPIYFCSVRLLTNTS